MEAMHTPVYFEKFIEPSHQHGGRRGRKQLDGEQTRNGHERSWTANGRGTDTNERSDEQHGGGCGRKRSESERMKDGADESATLLARSAAECVNEEEGESIARGFCFPFLLVFFF